MTEDAKHDVKPAELGGDDGVNERKGDGDHGNEPARALLAIQTADAAVAVAVDQDLRVYDKKYAQSLPIIHYLGKYRSDLSFNSCRSNELRVLLGEGGPGGDPTIVRCLAFSRCGRFLAAGSDDKIARVWSCDTWECIKSIRAPKKISVVSFNATGSVMLAANKFGDVLVTSTSAAVDGEAPFEILLGHYCSVLTSLSLSHDGKLLATTDRDAKVRVSIMPTDPLQGAHEIQSFAYGHTDFVSCSSFVRQGDAEVLVSGGGDGMIRIWDPLTGREICSLEIGKNEETQGNPNTSFARPVLALCPSQDGRHLVVALDGEAQLCLMELDISGGKIEEKGRSAVTGLPFATDICRDATGNFVFVSGPVSGSAPGAVLLLSAKLSADGTSLEACSTDLLTAEGRRQLQKCNEEEIGDVAPQKMLPSYLHKRPFVSFDEKNSRKKASKVATDATPGAQTK